MATKPENRSPKRETEFVAWFRSVAPYAHAFRGRNFVVAFGGQVVAERGFVEFVHDLSLLASLGVRLVLVHGARPQIEARLKLGGVRTRYVRGMRVTTREALECVKEAVGRARSGRGAALPGVAQLAHGQRRYPGRLRELRHGPPGGRRGRRGSRLRRRGAEGGRDGPARPARPGRRAPLKVLVSDADGRPLSGIPVNFTISKGGGSLSAGAVLTNAAGIASTILTLPANRASIQVLATSGDLSVTFTVTSIPVPTLQPDSVSDGVSFRGYTSPGPGSILSISGQNLAEAAAVAQSSLLPTLLRTTRVLLSSAGGDLWLPLFSVSPLLVKALLPPDLSPGAYRLCVEVASIRSKDVQISVAAYSPGIFTMNEDGRGPGIFIKTDGTQATAANPAERGATVTFNAAGLGAVNPPVRAGQPGAATEPLNRTVKSPLVYFDSYLARVLYSGLIPGVAGGYQVTVRIPAQLSRATNVAVGLIIGGFTSNRVTIPVR